MQNTSADPNPRREILPRPDDDRDGIVRRGQICGSRRPTMELCTASINSNNDGVVSVDGKASPEKVNATTSNNLELRPARWSASNRRN